MERSPTVLLFLSLLAAIYGCTNTPATLFVKVPAGKSNINFINTVTENDSINPLKMEFLYNGGGVAVGDFNNDSLPDLYFTASTSSNKLYLNKGKLRFEDITDAAKVTGEGNWSNGATVVDINNDGLEDIYVCTSIKQQAAQRTNLLYINQGPDKEGIPVFKDMAGEYGLADTSFSVQAVFFDYDKDGDLDMYLATTKLTSRNTYTFGNRKDSAGIDYDKLYRNDWNATVKHPVFTDVSQAAGIHEKGFGLGVTVSDLNNDGWPDIYVTNDFISSDHLYINNRNGGFSNEVKTSLKHTSQNAMGNDAADINNDGWSDLVAVDMNPEDNFRKQKNMGAANYAKYRNMVDFGYSLQFVRNTLQINQGTVNGPKDSVALPLFSDIAYYAGVAETDWSWTPSIADFDNDGWKDLLITNGYPKDVTDHDFMTYRNDNGYIVPEKTLLEQIPQIQVANYAYRNGPELRFQDVSAAWGLNDFSYSAGAAYADLDNDGDLDYIVNNTNSLASVYENKANSLAGKSRNWLGIRFLGDSLNRGGIGAKALVYSHGQEHMVENYPSRGYLSSVTQTAHFGLDSLGFADSIVILWPNGKTQRLGRTAANQTITVRASAAIEGKSIEKEFKQLFASINDETGINFLHTEYDYVDFDHQKLLPHKLSEYGPALAVGDIDGNGLDDIFVSGPKGKSASFLLQQNNGRFLQKALQPIPDPTLKPWEETGVLLIDIDNDKDLDLYLCSGSNEFSKLNPAYQDQLFTNDGKGNFTEQSAVLPANLASKQVLKAADIDLDGDLDLFIGSRVIPKEFPSPASGFLYRNDTKDGRISFTDITASLAPELKDLGLISDAVWSDFDGDGKVDLVVCGEFMPVGFFRNTEGKFKRTATGVEQSLGLWNSITPTDVDNDGRTDYIVGNLGGNSFYKGTAEQPFSIYAADFDKNGSYDAIPFLFLKDKKGKLGEFPAFTRDDMIKQLLRTKKQFPNYSIFADAGLDSILTPEERKAAIKVSANNMYSAVLKNKGNGKFELIPLPYIAQWAPVYGVLAEDMDQDGFIDLLLNTNDLGTEVNTGQYDALNGLFLKGTGDGKFFPQSMQTSGWYIPSNGKAIVKFQYKNDCAIAVSQNRGALKVYRLNGKNALVRIAPSETRAELYLKNGRVRKEEFYPGNSFLSQSARILLANEKISRVKIYSGNGSSREISFE